MIVHLLYENEYTFAYYEMIRDYFDVNEHLFIINDLNKHSWDKNRTFHFTDNLRVKSNLNKEVLKYLKNADVIVLHSLFDRTTLSLFFENLYLLKKTIWILWGNDFYVYREAGTKSNPYEVEEKRKVVIKNFAYISARKEDFELVQKIYNTNAVNVPAGYGLVSDFDDLDNCNSISTGNTTNILLGNSSTKTNQHIDSINILRKYKNENLAIYTPLSYGDKIYGKEVADYGISIFDRKFIPIFDFLPTNKYNILLKSIDIGIMNHNRQQAGGNIFTLLYLNKKVFINKDNTIYSHALRLGLNVYDIKLIHTQNFGDFKHHNIINYTSNKNILREFISKDQRAKTWKDIFELVKKDNNKINNDKLKYYLQKINWEYKLNLYKKSFEYVKFFNKVDNPNISVVIITWRFHPDTLKNLQILNKQRDQNFELIFVNNGAIEDELKILEPYIDTYVKLNHNTGAYLARNLGAIFAKAAILLFLDDDGIPESNIINAHLNQFKKYKIVSCRGAIFPKTKDNPYNAKARHYYLGDKTKPIYADIEGNTSYLSSIFFEVGGWDDAISFGGGAYDLSIRLGNSGIDLREQIYSPEPIIYHDYALDDKHIQIKIQTQEQSFERLKKKHPNWNEFRTTYKEQVGSQSPIVISEYSANISKSKPLMSIIVPNYNNEQYIDMCIQSVLYQTEENWELIIVDDASTDNSVLLIKKYLNDKRIKLIQHTTNKQIGQTTINGILNSSSKIFGTLDGDDCLAQDAIEVMVKAHKEHPNAGMIYSQFVFCDKNLNPKRIGFCGPIPKGKTNLDSDKVSHFKTFKRKYYDQTIGYEPTINCAVDKDITYKMEEIGELVFINKPLYYYRILKDSVSHISSNKANMKQTLLRSQINAIKRRREISYHKNKNAISYFENAINLFFNGNDDDSNISLNKYKQTIDYESFAKYDNRKSNNPKLSIIISTKNSNTELIDTLNSLQNQVDSNSEIIITDNIQNDNILPILFKLPILYISVPKNLNEAECLNIGVYFAKGEFLVFLDDDSTVNSNWIEILFYSLYQANVMAVKGKTRLINSCDSNNQPKNTTVKSGITYFNELNSIINFTLKKKIFLKYGGLSPLLGNKSINQFSKNIVDSNINIIYSTSLIVNYKDKLANSYEYINTEDAIKKKVLFICHDFPPYRYAGAQLFAKNLAQAINKTGKAQVEILYPQFRDKNKQDYSITQTSYEDLTIYELNRPQVSEIQKMFDEEALKSIYNFLKHNHYDLIHIHGLGHITQAPIYAADKLNIKLIMTLHDHWFMCSNWHLIKRNGNICTGPENIEKCARCFVMNNKSFPNTPENYEISYNFHSNREELFRDAYAKISHFYAPSNYLMNKFNTYGYNNISVLNNGLKHTASILNNRKYDSNMNLIVGYSGQITQTKGTHILVDAFKQIQNQNIELHIWGKINLSTVYGKNLKKAIDSDSRVKYFGEYHNSKINEIISSFDIMVIPSLMDNYPITVQEAFHNKMPVIGSNTGGIPEMITHNVNGLLFEVSSVSSLIEALNKVINNPILIEQFRENIPEIKSLETNANEYLSEYSKYIPNFDFRDVSNILQKKSNEKGGYIVQFYIYKSVHWAMFKDYIEYLNTQGDIYEIVLCLPNVGNLTLAGKYDLVDELFNTGYKIVTNPQDANADITYIADTIAGKVYGCGYIVNLGHGTISKGYYFTESVWTERENLVDMLCVPGDYAKSKFDEILNTNVVATGMPKLDKVFSKQYDKKSLCDYLNLDFSKPIILYAPTFNIDLSSVYNFVANFHKIDSNDYYVLIKLHGSTIYETIEKYRDIAHRYKNIIFIEDTNIAPYIGGADLLISDVSSVFMEFMALDKPVILYDNPNRENYHGYNPENIEYEWRDLGTRVNSFDELLQVMPHILKFGDNKSRIRQKYAKELFADLNGQASINVWNETKKLLNSNSKPKRNDVLSLVMELSPDLLPIVRSELQNIQFYSVMPLEIVFVTQNKEQLSQFFDELRFSNEFYKIKIVDRNPNIDPIIQGLQSADGDYIAHIGNGVSIYKNYDYIIYNTFKLNEDKIAFTGLTNSNTSVLNYKNYISNDTDENFSRHAYNFINEYQCKDIKLVDSISELPRVIIIKNGIINFQNYDNFSELVHNLVDSRKLYANLSLFYTTLPEKLILDITKVWRERDKFTFQDRIKTFSEVLQYVVLPDIAEVLIKDMLSINFDKNELVTTVYQSLYSRYYDFNFKEELYQNFKDTPNINEYLSENIRVIRRLKELKGKSRSKTTNKVSGEQQISTYSDIAISQNKPKILFYFFKNVHIPILEPIYRKLKAKHPEAQIAFGYMSYAPHIRAGFTDNEFELLQAFGEKLYNNPQDFNPDITFIADSCYEFVQNCGLLIHVGHGVLSKGQYYTDTALARREEYADLVCVPGEYHKKILNNIISKPVVATGMAKLDSLYDGTITKEKIIRQLRLNPKHKYILFAPTFNDELSAIPFISDRINEVIPDDNTFLIIKLHSSTKQEYKDMYRKLFRKDARVIYVEDLNIAPYLALSDIMISDVSSAMIEFASLDKPLILFNNPNWKHYKHYNPNDIEFKWRDIGIQVNNLEEMKQAVVRSFNNPNEFSQKRIYYTDQLIANKLNANASLQIIDSAFELLRIKSNKISRVRI